MKYMTIGIFTSLLYNIVAPNFIVDQSIEGVICCFEVRQQTDSLITKIKHEVDGIDSSKSLLKLSSTILTSSSIRTSEGDTLNVYVDENRYKQQPSISKIEFSEREDYSRYLKTTIYLVQGAPILIEFEYHGISEGRLVKPKDGKSIISIPYVNRKNYYVSNWDKNFYQKVGAFPYDANYETDKQNVIRIMEMGKLLSKRE